MYKLIKKMILVLISIVPILGNAQAHLGESLSGLQERYPDKTFKIEYAKDGTKYALVDQPLGTFAYYFDQETDLTYMCIQIPDNLQALNTQVEIYNKKYVIVSESSWKAYLEGGGIMKINLTYNQEHGTYWFLYTR